ncbi:MAG: hypothetical protein PHI31_01525 [Desulfuromonadaceae bacterium]|nr:hypothetical protein [Desulfuromonadaceae bacterium]
MSRQNCAVCAWRETCSKRFSIPDNGARCPDFSRDIRIKDVEENATLPDQKEQTKK